MTAKRLTKEAIRRQTGILNPVGHVVLAFATDAVTASAVSELHESGFSVDDTLVYLASEATPRLRERVASASASAGFGYEINLMHRYLALAEEGCGWLIVYAPTDEAVARIVEVATRHEAKCAVRYHLLANEDLI